MVDKKLVSEWYLANVTAWTTPSFYNFATPILDLLVTFD